MQIEFNPMTDDRYANQRPILLNVSGVVHEASFEMSRNWFYLHHHWQIKGDAVIELPEYIPEDDERLLGWAFCEPETVAVMDGGEDRLCAYTMDDIESRVGEVNGRLHELESRQAIVDLLEDHKSNWVPDSKGGEKNCFINEHFRALYMEGRK